MAKKKFYIIGEHSLDDCGYLAEDEEVARDYAKKLSAERPQEKFFIMQAVEYGICNIEPCTFFTPEFIVDEEDPQEAEATLNYTEAVPIGMRANGDTFGGMTPGEVFQVTAGGGGVGGTTTGRFRTWHQAGDTIVFNQAPEATGAAIPILPF